MYRNLNKKIKWIKWELGFKGQKNQTNVLATWWYHPATRAEAQRQAPDIFYKHTHKETAFNNQQAKPSTSVILIWGQFIRRPVTQENLSQFIQQKYML